MFDVSCRPMIAGWRCWGWGWWCSGNGRVISWWEMTVYNSYRLRESVFGHICSSARLRWLSRTASGCRLMSHDGDIGDDKLCFSASASVRSALMNTELLTVRSFDCRRDLAFFVRCSACETSLNATNNDWTRPDVDIWLWFQSYLASFPSCPVN